MLGAKPETTRHIVMSVPHSGTRTLQSWLSENRPWVVPDDNAEIKHWHFSLHPKYCERYFELGGARMAYIPLRNPYDVADSWERRYFNASVDKSPQAMIQALGMMVECVEKYPDNIEIFKMEDLPVLRGIGPNPENWDRMVETERSRDLRRWVLQTTEVEAFYRTYYTAEELWWL